MLDAGLIRHAQWAARSRLSRWPALGLGLGRPFSGRAGVKRIMLLSEPNAICQSQIFPFHFHLAELQHSGRCELREVNTAAFEAEPDRGPQGADVVLVQTWFDLTRQRCDELFAKVRLRHPGAKTVFLDSFAPTDLRLAEMTDRHVDLYVKKHLLRDRAQYGQPTRGDTNLTDWYGRHFGLEQPLTTFAIPPGFLNKLVVGPTFFTSSKMLPHFHSTTFSSPAAPTIDIHARLAFKGSDWYTAMRRLAVDAVEALAVTDGLRVESQLGVPFRVYMDELAKSRLCFSPFGYGEVCWRDYEAAMCGVVLVKPEMSHIETAPDIFSPWQTYAPVAWDFSDLREVVQRCLADRDASSAMARRAYSLLQGYARTGAFATQMKRVLE